MGPVFSLDELFADPQAQHLALRREMPHPRVGTVSQTGFPYQLSKTGPALRLPPPLLGQHTAEVLGELGYSEQQIEALRARGVV